MAVKVSVVALFFLHGWRLAREAVLPALGRVCAGDVVQRQAHDYRVHRRQAARSQAVWVLDGGLHRHQAHAGR